MYMQMQTEDSEDDVVDSDFDVSEEGERGDSADEEEEPQKKKKKWAKLILAKTKVGYMVKCTLERMIIQSPLETSTSWGVL